MKSERKIKLKRNVYDIVDNPSVLDVFAMIVEALLFPLIQCVGDFLWRHSTELIRTEYYKQTISLVYDY